MMHIMYHTLIFCVQVPVAYLSSLISTFLKTFFMSGFLSFSFFFQGKFWGFLHKRVAALVAVGEKKIVASSPLALR